MLNAIKRFFTTCPYDGCNIPRELVNPNLDFGNGFKARQLINGKWVLERDGMAIDMKHVSFSWKPGTRFYESCMVDDYNTLLARAKDAMAYHGI